MPAKTRVTLRMVYQLVESVDARTGRLEVISHQLAKTTDRIDASILVIEQKVESMRVRLETLPGIVDGLIQKMSMLLDEQHSISAQLKRLGLSSGCPFSKRKS